jgi:carbonic anhydrase
METFLVLLAASLTVTSAAIGSFDYANQTAWRNISATCATGMRQSPIAITSDDAVKGDKLIDLSLTGWDVVREGSFNNTGTSVKFTPNVDESKASTTNHEGVYELQQFHIHWGAMNNVGSEHVVDNVPASAEIHFVHRQNSVPEDAGNAYAVVGVMAVVDEDATISGVWNDLNVTGVQGFEEKINTTVRFNDLLPATLSYYYYKGSLTTPACSEVVQWFLLTETITIPQAYLVQLRTVQHNAEGTPLTFNYRETQDLNGRTVLMHSPGSSGVKPLLSATAIFIVLLAIGFRA